jgi:hypothetical protein
MRRGKRLRRWMGLDSEKMRIMGFGKKGRKIKGEGCRLDRGI